MSYTPPASGQLHFVYIDVQWCILAFNFNASYSPPGSTALHFDFTIVLFPIHFEFAPVNPEPISKELLKSLAFRLSGQVYKYWVCFVWRGQQRVRRYWEHDLDPSPWTTASQAKFAAGVKAWQNLSHDDNLKWRRVGARKKEPITSINAFLSAWMRDKIP